MDSPQMYDNNTHPAIASADIGVKKVAPGNNLTNINNVKTASLLSKFAYHPQDPQSDLADLNTPEISLDLQNLIDDQFHEQDRDLFTELLSGSQKTSPHQGLPHGVRASGALLGGSYPRTTLAYMPQPVHSASNYNNANNSSSSSSTSSSSLSDASSASPGSVAIKEEPLDPTDFRSPCHQLPPSATANGNAVAVPVPYSNSYSPPSGNSFASNGAGPTFTTLTPTTVPGSGVHHPTTPAHQHGPAALLAMGKNALVGKAAAVAAAAAAAAVTNPSALHQHHHHHHHHARKNTKTIDKASDEYRRRRERNNIAVRKSREKAKLRSKETEEKVKLLMKDNERLQKKIEMLNEELSVLRNLFANVGVAPDHIHREITKHFDIYHQPQQNQGL